MEVRLRFRDGVKRHRWFRGLRFGRDGVSLRTFQSRNPKIARLLHGFRTSEMFETVPAVAEPLADSVQAETTTHVVEDHSDSKTDAAAVDPVAAASPPPVVSGPSEPQPPAPPPTDRMAAARAAKAARRASSDATGRSGKSD